MNLSARHQLPKRLPAGPGWWTSGSRYGGRPAIGGLPLVVGIGTAIGVLSPWLWSEPTGSEVHEVSLWLTDPSANVFNARDRFSARLPGSRAPTPSEHASEPVPLALLTFYGPPVESLEVDIRAPSGRFLAHWPPGRKRNQRLSWYEARLRTSLDKDQLLKYVPPAHWIRGARQGSGLYVQFAANVERFLAYQAELKLPLPVDLQGGPDTYQVENQAGYALLDVMLSVATVDGPRLGWLERLSARATEAADPSSDDACGQTAASETSRRQVVPLVTPLRLADPSPPERAAEALTRRLQAAGLADWEAELLTSQLSLHLFQRGGLVMLFRLPPQVLDEWLPLEIYPRPDKTVRVGLVLVRDMNPADRVHIDRLVGELGDPVFSVRQSAHERLLKLGSAARSALRQAQQHDDPEIALRATRILRQQGEVAP